ncbi:MAG: hypothetical protein CMB53_01295 [Euryarchaeota archaeon]|nr:hypothetical protein [Euryarchaeota archaeon]|tara:strand:- start:5082 stop:5879 length:798 start_codon:yes stop_codon:yes gene_type:complete
MGSTVVIKMGGGLITDKSKHKSVKMGVIDSLSNMVSILIEEGNSVIIVHGAGSFGHLTAKEWGLSEGVKEEISEEQRGAVVQVRADMIELCGFVMRSLEGRGLECKSLPPSNWATGTGSDFSGSLQGFIESSQSEVMVTFGDVVEKDDHSEFGILSGDDLMARLSIEIPGVEYSIFLLGDSPGMMDMPPNMDGAELLDVWSPGIDAETFHNTEEDVTGGIELKARRAAEIARHVPNVWFIDGREPSRVVDLVVDGLLPIGTKILP